CAAAGCDLFVAAGTSLVVGPINQMLVVARKAGARIAILTASETPYDAVADWKVDGRVEAALPPRAVAILPPACPRRALVPRRERLLVESNQRASAKGANHERSTEDGDLCCSGARRRGVLRGLGGHRRQPPPHARGPSHDPRLHGDGCAVHHLRPRGI